MIYNADYIKIGDDSIIIEVASPLVVVVVVLYNLQLKVAIIAVCTVYLLAIYLVLSLKIDKNSMLTYKGGKKINGR